MPGGQAISAAEFIFWRTKIIIEAKLGTYLDFIEGIAVAPLSLQR